MDVWSTEASGKHVVGFRPYEREEKDGKQVKWAAFVDASHLLTLSSKGRVVLWTIPECQVVYSIKTDGHSVPAVSAGRRYVAVGTSKGVLMFNALTGQSMGKLGDRAAWTSVLSFNPAGTMLACSEGMGQSRVLSVYDLKSGKLAAEVMLPKALRDPGIDWVSPGYVVVGREYLVELERLMVVWRFERPRVGVSVKAGGDERYWYVTSEQDRLMNVALPDEAAKKAIGAVKAEELAVRPGMKVTLEVSTASNDEATRKKVTDALVKRLKENGLTVADGQPVRLVASVTTKGGKEMKYRRMGRLGDETVQTTEFDARLAFEVDGQVAWESQTTGSNAQFFVSAKADESISDVLNRNIPELGVSFLTGSPLPKYVPKPSETVGFGYSKFTSRGVEVAEPPKGGQ